MLFPIPVACAWPFVGGTASGFANAGLGLGDALAGGCGVSGADGSSPDGASIACAFVLTFPSKNMTTMLLPSGFCHEYEVADIPGTLAPEPSISAPGTLTPVVCT